MKKRKRTRLKYKRLVLSSIILVIVGILITKVSREIHPKYNEDKTPTTNGAVAAADIDKEVGTDNTSRGSSDLHNENGKFKVQENFKDMEKVEDVEETETLTGKEEGLNKFNDYKEVFKEDLFFGDSITDSLSFYEFIDESNVVAKFGLTAKGAKDEVQNIVKINPKSIFIMFGMNDILTDEDSNQFADDYAELIYDIKEKLPDTKIYVQSILSVAPKVKDKKPLLTNENIDKFNEALKDMAKNENVEYLNIRTILEENKDLLEPDGIHVKYKFYKLWLDYLIENIK